MTNLKYKALNGGICHNIYQLNHPALKVQGFS